MTMPLWTGEEVRKATGGRIAGAFSAAGGASIDTRTVKAGDLFFAITGESRDGHDFVRDALSKGAAAAVVAEDRAAEFADAGPLIVVDDVLAAMGRLGAAARARSRARIVAITGSVGKTGTKEAMRLALARLGETHASVASYNNQWGVPLTLARMPRDSAFGIFEIGMNHAGEIVPLAAMVRPHVAVVTTIEPVHIEYFRSIWGIVDAKGEIFSGLAPGGAAVIGRDGPYFERLRAHAQASPAGRIVTFGEGEAADVRAERIVLKPDLSVVEARIFGKTVAYRIGTPGRHVALNSLAVLAAASALGCDVAAVASALSDLKPPVGRGERTILDLGRAQALLIDESYNANPASVRAALATLAAVELPSGARRIVVLGDMRELGDEAAALHRDLAAPIEAAKVDLVFTAGDLMQNLVSVLPPSRRAAHAQDAAGLVDAVAAALAPGDAIMIKGSNSMRMAQIVAALKERFGPGARRALKG